MIPNLIDPDDQTLSFQKLQNMLSLLVIDCHISTFQTLDERAIRKEFSVNSVWLINLLPGADKTSETIQNKTGLGFLDEKFFIAIVFKNYVEVKFVWQMSYPLQMVLVLIVFLPNSFKISTFKFSAYVK